MLRTLILTAVVLIMAGMTAAQTTSITYQGELTDGGAPATGNYFFQFSLFPSDVNGTQIGPTLTYDGASGLAPVHVANGIFTVVLDFGAGTFTGEPRWLEIAVKKPAEPGYTTMTSRILVTSSPYAVKSLSADAAAFADTAGNADQLGGVAANQYVQTTDPRLSDQRAPLAGSPNYIQNSVAQQAAANFNISGNGYVGGSFRAPVINALSYLELGNTKVLSRTGTQNLFAGELSGDGGSSNSFFGYGTGTGNTSGFRNSFVGSTAGSANTTGNNNSFFGASSGTSNTTGIQNSFFGTSAGGGNVDGSANAFFGTLAGASNTSGSRNTAVGVGAGGTNATGIRTTLIGSDADTGTTDLSNATAIGANSYVEQSNSLILGSIAGKNGATSNTKVGIGTTTPKAAVDVRGGNIYVGSNGNGVLLKSPDGATCRLISISNAGVLVLTPIVCP